MTGYTIGWRIQIISTGMAFGAICNVVSFGQREKVVIYLVGRPAETVHIMAIRTIGGKTDALVVWAGSGRIIGQVAIDTIISDALKLQTGFRFMTIRTGGNGVRANERKTVVVVQFRNIVHQPVLCIMTPGAVFSDGSVVQIGVTGNAVGIGIRKNHGFMAGPAIHPHVLAG